MGIDVISAAPLTFEGEELSPFNHNLHVRRMGFVQAFLWVDATTRKALGSISRF